MIAVVEIGGKQYTLENWATLVVDHQHVPVGQEMSVPALLLASADGTDVRVGTPIVEGSKVTLRVEEHLKADKVRVFKIKSKKRYMRTRGFRALQTRLTVVGIA